MKKLSEEELTKMEITITKTEIAILQLMADAIIYNRKDILDERIEWGKELLHTLGRGIK